MDYNKIGAFIKKIRVESALTQEQLAEKIPISRQAVSKWENGVAIPDPTTLIRLSEIFDITINEILYGERINPQNKNKINHLALRIYKECTNRKKIIKILTFLLTVSVLSFFVYFFINSYKSIVVYNVYGSNSNVDLSNGIFVRTNDKLYFSLSSIKSDLGDVSYIDLYYFNNNNNNKIMISHQDDDFITIVDHKGYDEYFDSNNLDEIINNMYVDIVFGKNKETIKLTFKKDFINDKLLFWDKMPSTNDSDDNLNYSKKENYSFLKKEIYNTFSKIDNSYLYEFPTDSEYSNFKMHYSEITDTIFLEKYINKTIVESWSLDFQTSSLFYNSYNNSNDSFNITDGVIVCESGSCDNSENKEKEFWQVVNFILGSN